MSILRNLGSAVRRVLGRQPFPLRCQHCDTPIRPDGHFHLIETPGEVPAFVDRLGFHRCCPAHRTPHAPMDGAR